METEWNILMNQLSILEDEKSSRLKVYIGGRDDLLRRATISPMSKEAKRMNRTRNISPVSTPGNGGGNFDGCSAYAELFHLRFTSASYVGQRLYLFSFIPSHGIRKDSYDDLVVVVL
ncbi:hypothetical protein CHS0354_025738 [Potamilus streckersoni]|uniref:Uncharacterized protein n=1 Tax=Potamilus streckersoni TaxID=2493646 RepID=A0AAE0SEB2_9BIVA|nr:hypothetical protein CHS0354_025738 [Potamilus streckersoni]